MVAPQLTVAADRIHGCTPRLMRLLALFAFGRCVTVNRPQRHVIISTRRFWLWQRVRIVSFDRIARILYRAQAVPVLAPWRYLSLNESSHTDSALFFISIALQDERDELPLFTVWERQPREPDWLDKLARAPLPEPRIGDETAGHIVALLREYLDVPVRQY